MIVKRLLSLGLSLSMSLSMIGNSVLPIFAQEEIEEVEEITTEDPALEEDLVVETIVEEAEPEEEEETIEIEAELGDQNNPIPLTEGISSMYQLSSGEVLWFYYTIDQNFSKYVVLESLGNDDVKAELYTMGMVVAESDDDGDGYNFKFEQVGQAGNTYKVKVEAYNSNNDVEFQLKFSMNPYGKLTQGPITYASCWYIVDGTLYVETQGKIPDSHAGGTPWASYTDLIKRVVIKDGVTEIGAYCFSLLGKLESITLPNSLYIIDENAFMGTTEFENVIYDGYKEDWISITFGNENSYPTKYSKTITMSDGTYSTDIVIDKSQSVTEKTIKVGGNVYFVVVPQGDISDYDFSWNYSGGSYNTYSDTNISGGYIVTCTVKNIYGKSIEVPCDVSVIKKPWTVEGDSQAVPYGGSTYLFLDFTKDSDTSSLSYQWYKANGDGSGTILNNETKNFLYLTNITQGAIYYCVVKDTDGNQKEVYSSVRIQEAYTLKYTDNVVEVEPGESVDIRLTFLNFDNSKSVNQSVLNGTIVWNDGYNDLAGEHNTWLHVSNVLEKKTYYCTFTDQYGNSRKISYVVKVKQDWAIKTGTIRLEENEGASVRLDIPYIKLGTSTLTYEWKNWSTYKIDATTESYTVPSVSSKACFYVVTVKDEYGNSSSVIYEITVIKAPDWKVKNKEVNTIVKRGEGAPIGLEFEEGSNLENLSFTWYHDGNRWEGLYPGFVYIWDIEKNEKYTCTIEDNNGNMETVVFNYYIEKEWEIEFTGKLDNGVYRQEIVEQYAPYNQDVTLSVPFSVDSDTSHVHISWMDYDRGYVSSALNPVIKNAKSNQTILVTVKDDYGYSESFYYYLYIGQKTEFDDQYTDNTQHIFVKKGEDLTIVPNLTSDSGYLARSYDWEVEFPDYGADFETKTELYPKEYNNHPEYILKNIQEDITLTCTIKDTFGLTKVRKYVIVVEDQYTIDYNKTITTIYANPGEDVTATVYFLEDAAQDNLEFIWSGRQPYADVRDQITSDKTIRNQNSVTIENITKSATCFCTIKKSGKTIAKVPFEIRVNNKNNTTIVLEDKTVTYTGENIEIEPAMVTGSTGEIKYTYYTNPECTSLTSLDDGASLYGYAPVNPGTYYVKAHVLSDANYNEAYSEAAVLTIEKTTLLGRAITLSEDITMKYYVNLDSIVKNDSGAYMEFKVGNRISKWNVEYSYTIYKDGVLCNVFLCQLPVKDLTTTIEAKLYNSNGEVILEDSYSVEAYAQYIYENYDKTSREYEATQKLMTYGYYAQVYFNYNTNNLPDNITNLVNMNGNSYNYSCIDNNNNVDFVGARLVLGYRPGLKLYFNGDADFKLDNQSADVIKEGKYTVIIISEISYVYQIFNITATDFSLEYSIPSYWIKGNSLTSTNPNLANLCKAMKMYYDLFSNQY